jgi:hypothetical protein
LRIYCVDFMVALYTGNIFCSSGDVSLELRNRKALCCKNIVNLRPCRAKCFIFAPQWFPAVASKGCLGMKRECRENRRQ